MRRKKLWGLGWRQIDRILNADQHRVTKRERRRSTCKASELCKIRSNFETKSIANPFPGLGAREARNGNRAGAIGRTKGRYSNGRLGNVPSLGEKTERGFVDSSPGRVVLKGSGIGSGYGGGGRRQGLRRRDGGKDHPSQLVAIESQPPFPPLARQDLGGFRGHHNGRYHRAT